MLKSERFAFNLSPQENEALKDLAEIEGGLSRSALVRRLIRAEATKYGVWPRQAIESPNFTLRVIRPDGGPMKEENRC